MKLANIDKRVERRINPRNPYSGSIFFATKNGFWEGRLKNYSRFGLFIETNVSLGVGDILIIALPYLNLKHTKCRGQIVRCKKKGLGIELFRKRKATNLKIIK